MTSKVCHQFELLAKGEPHVEPVTPELIRSIRRRQTFNAAWNYAQDFAGLDDKQCYGPLGIEASHWSKIRSGRASPPGDERFRQYFDVVRNQIPAIWLVESLGLDWMTLRPHLSTEQQRIAQLEAENRELKRSMMLWAEAQKGRP